MKVLRLLGELKELGGEGLEVVSGSHSLEETYVYARHAREQGLLASAGSDFHSPGHPFIELGRLPPLPEGCVPVWEAWDIRRRARTAMSA
jgi:predicted metal-dependent phosphoesterase TrpH